MAATLVLEDGTGVINSNTYQLLADFKTYFGNLGVDISGITDPQITAALFETGTILLEVCFKYKGYITYPLTPQALSWPRTGLVDRRGLVVAVDSIPPELQAAQNELAKHVALEVIAGNRYAYSDSPSNIGAEKRNKLDTLEEEFYGPGTAANLQISSSVSAYVSKLLKPYITGGNAFQVVNVAVI